MNLRVPAGPAFELVVLLGEEWRGMMATVNRLKLSLARPVTTFCGGPGSRPSPSYDISPLQALRVMVNLSTHALLIPVLNSMAQVYNCSLGGSSSTSGAIGNTDWLGTGISCFGGSHIIILVGASSLLLTFAIGAIGGGCAAQDLLCFYYLVLPFERRGRSEAKRFTSQESRLGTCLT
jgi:hypothetical protein